MPQSEVIPIDWRAATETTSGELSADLVLESSSNGIETRFSFSKVQDGIFRTTFTSDDHPLPPWPSIPREGGPKVNGHSSTTVKSDTNNVTKTQFSIALESVTATVDWKEGPPIVSIFSNGKPDEILHHDLPHRSYVVDGQGIAHYTRYKQNTLHVGLGEKAAPMDLSNRHFVLSTTDSFGYDVYRTDPLYKHIPLLVNATADYAVATFSTSHSRGVYAIGSEVDGLWGRYKVYRQDFGGLEEYIIVGKTLQEVVRKYAGLVGYPLLVPRWAFGYLAGGMKYSMLDEPRASEALMEFAAKLNEHDIPCSGFQMSSGYTVAEVEPKTRNVFTWNKHRFPDPKGFIDAYHSKGIRLIANVKPYILGNHPEYERLRAAGAFFTDPVTGSSAQARLWSAGGGESGVGGHIDFTSRAGYEFWYEGVKELRRLGIDCIWNDNNEFTISDDHWKCALDEKIVPSATSTTQSKEVGIWGRYMHTELMGKASHDAAVAAEPEERPFILTRSATAGTMRYCASSWSGDNVTSWEGMKGGNALSLTAGICLLQCYGHDIGGFEGPQPSPELLVRWVQLGIYSPRFAINCFKTSPENNNVGDVIELWMYPEYTHIVRAAIRRRYEMIPYLYSLMLRSHLYAEPPQRWTGWDYPNDSEVWKNRLLKDGETQYFLGEALLIGGVYESDGETAKMYLPRSNSGSDDVEQFINLNAPHQILKAGQWVNIESKWTESIPVLAKIGTLIPVGRPVQTLSPGEKRNPANLPLDDYRAVELFPPHGNSPSEGYSNSWLEDDGISPAPSAILEIQLVYSCDEHAVNIVEYSQTMLDKASEIYTPPWKELRIILPFGDERVVTFKGNVVTFIGKDDKQRACFKVTINTLVVR